MQAHTRYYLSSMEIKDYKFMINDQNVFVRPLKNGIRIYKNT